MNSTWRSGQYTLPDHYASSQSARLNRAARAAHSLICDSFRCLIRLLMCEADFSRDFRLIRANGWIPDWFEAYEYQTSRPGKSPGAGVGVDVSPLSAFSAHDALCRYWASP